jgi:outer membrane lipase/esterase
MNRTRAHVRPPALRTGLLALATAGTLLLASCGGGGSGDQAVKFKPTRMVVFGDETSLLLPPSTPTAIDGRKYGINGFTLGVTPPVPDCQENPIWVQLLAREHGLVFGQCNPTNAPVTALMRAANGAKVADVVVALDTFLAADKLGSKDLVNIFVGTHDVLELYEKVRAGTLTEAAAVAEAARRGGVLATQFDRITNKSNSGSRALYLLIPDLGQTPLAVSAVDGRAERVRLLTLLTERFNNQLRGQITNNGRSIGLVDAMQEFRNVISGRTSVSFSNLTTAACVTALLVDCTTATLVPVANLGALEQQQTWLWADSYHLSPGAHAVLSDRAIYITRNNPF